MFNATTVVDEAYFVFDPYNQITTLYPGCPIIDYQIT